MPMRLEERAEPVPECRLVQATLESTQLLGRGGQILQEPRVLQSADELELAERGTGGSSGVAYLRSTLDKRFFPELWGLRADL